MKDMRKLVALILALVLTLACVPALAGDGPEAEDENYFIYNPQSEGVVWLTQTGAIQYLHQLGIPVDGTWQEEEFMCIALENGYVFEIPTHNDMIALETLALLIEENKESVVPENWISLEDACEILFKIRGNGLPTVQVVFTEADSVIVEYRVGDERVAYYVDGISSPAPIWRIYEGRVQITEEVVMDLIKQL